MPGFDVSFLVKMIDLNIFLIILPTVIESAQKYFTRNLKENNILSSRIPASSFSHIVWSSVISDSQLSLHILHADEHLVSGVLERYILYVKLMRIFDAQGPWEPQSW